ncbi:crossover junction endodeoxyribonuclease RuvC [Paenibacillus alvei]|uniref:crossover junction endodeoxyribonuclease RuvC n=1 Tax=Paenibacillus alvei TaxID=44250 RepID=UPI0022807587|nr:crossover junction endodeoxyribonuclease RuvC [Paenibacillus alvei]MCY9541830.1 crossover junction endodeoxyribonuclease RuvC [Paenibacillus alvei]MCY9704981.1 crossover junction endodeoxyribonuclease RuvC [Paenibacillus alvei]MCY9755322.1 crossover junction endodeoxyribonuclease RuvC [Paenibacillus alvei]MEC0082473.1 crossover junction endodeoxyribonuclease RuvC [Paenibacillus alvei]
MKTMGIDHGTNHAGWATMSNGKPIDFGLRDYSEIKMPFVLDAIYQDTYNMLRKEQPDIVVLERPVHFKNANSVIALVGAYSMVNLAALHQGIKIAEIRPSELKLETGKGNADKETVAIEMQMLFGLDYDEIAIPVLYQRDDPKGKFKKGDIRDRLFDPSDAIALCWAFHQKLKKGKGAA